MAEAATCGFAQTAAKAEGLDAREVVEHYLSREHRDAPGEGCTMAALCADAARQPESIKTAFAAASKACWRPWQTGPTGRRAANGKATGAPGASK